MVKRVDAEISYLILISAPNTYNHTAEQVSSTLYILVSN